jgi:hypothetical protein
MVSPRIGQQKNCISFLGRVISEISLPLSLLSFSEMGTELRTSHMLGKHFTTELHTQPLDKYF